jgi:hypothetical protein
MCQMRGIRAAVLAGPLPGRVLTSRITGALRSAAGALDGGGSRYLSYDAACLWLIFAMLIISFPGRNAR